MNIEEKLNWFERNLLAMSITFIVIILSALIFRLSCVTFIDNHELGYKFDAVSGKISILDKKGYVLTPPIVVKVHTIDLRPMQVCINANSRVLNCKLVKFDPKGFETFIKWHGRDDYNITTQGYDSKFMEIMKSYAYDESKNPNEYPFLKIEKELKTKGNE